MNSVMRYLNGTFWAVLFVVLQLSLSAVCLHAQVMAPAEMPNVQVANRDQYVSDPAGLLSADVKSAVNQRLTQLRAQTSVEAVVAIPPEIGDVEPVEWCEQLFTQWGIGKSDKDNGVLMMISPGSRKAFIITGYGVEGVLTDISCKNIVEQAIIPAMRDGDLDRAVNDATILMVNALEDPAVAEELRSSQADNTEGALSAIDKEVIINFIMFVAGLMFTVSLCLFVKDCIASRRRTTNYAKAEMWRGHMVMYFWLGVVSAGTGLIFFLLAWFLYRSWRMRPLKCSTCGAKMKRLPEDKDNELLNDSQDFEEKIKTVDYDVWECPKCGTIERFPYKANQKKYTECPQCHTIAVCLQCDMTVKAPTTRSEGQGVKVYECQYCHHRKNIPYRIPGRRIRRPRSPQELS